MKTIRNKNELTSKQIRAAEMLAVGGVKHQEVCDELNISLKTLTNWKHLDKFNDYVLLRARELLKESLPDVYSVLTSTGKKGSVQHIKVMLDHLEHLEEIASNARSSTITFTWITPNTIQQESNEVDDTEDND